MIPESEMEELKAECWLRANEAIEGWIPGRGSMEALVYATVRYEVKKWTKRRRKVAGRMSSYEDGVLHRGREDLEARLGVSRSAKP